jgi:phosphohistidine swiveling domain-containing protein
MKGIHHRFERAYLLPLQSYECTNSSLVGSKAARLAQLALQGFSVPAGYVVTVKGFRDFCAYNNIRITDESPPQDLARAIPNGNYPSQLAEEITLALDRLSVEQFAIRSSAIGEDGFVVSMAGQLQTFLCIPRVSVLDGIKKCWAAIFSAGVSAYRLKKQLTLTQEMGVIIQRQIQPLYAGVLFTLDPRLLTTDYLVVEWVDGLGEQLVSGKVNPQRLHLHRKTPIFPKSLAEPQTKALEQLLSLGLQAERLFGHPLDLEWCVDTSGVQILQARPITALSSEQVSIWSNVNIGENYPQPLSSFTWSVVESFRFAYFRALFKCLGLPESATEEAYPVIQNLVGVHMGKAYYNLSNWYEMMVLFPMGRWFRKFLDYYIGQRIPFTYVPRYSKLRMFQEWRSFHRKIWFWARLLLNYLTLEQQVATFEDQFNASRKKWRSQPLDRLSLVELDELLLNIMGFLDRRWGGATLADLSAMVFPGLLELVTRKWLKEYPEAEKATPRLLQGLTLKSTESLKLISEMTQKIRVRPDLRELLLAQKYDVLEQFLDHELKELLNRFMEQFGGRCYHELLITSPTFEERPDLFWDLVRSYDLAPEPYSITKEKTEVEKRKRFTSEVLQKLSWIRRPVFKKVLRDAQKAIRFRERVRLCQSLIYGELRRVALELGKRLAVKGYFNETEDVFFLEVEELHQLIQGKFLYPGSLPSLIQIRKEAHATYSKTEPPEFFILDKGDSLQPLNITKSIPEGKTILKGLGVSGGRVKGKAKCILNPVEDNPLKPGDILVTRSTDPGWTPLFLIAGGLILEKGGLLSHGAIVAREFGIPAVVGVEGATQLIHDGQWVSVDGHLGEVQILSDESERC